jgi:hypothetical protein
MQSFFNETVALEQRFALDENECQLHLQYWGDLPRDDGHGREGIVHPKIQVNCHNTYPVGTLYIFHSATEPKIRVSQ